MCSRTEILISYTVETESKLILCSHSWDIPKLTPRRHLVKLSCKGKIFAQNMKAGSCECLFSQNLLVSNKDLN